MHEARGKGQSQKCSIDGCTNNVIKGRGVYWSHGARRKDEVVNMGMGLSRGSHANDEALMDVSSC